VRRLAACRDPEKEPQHSCNMALPSRRNNGFESAARHDEIFGSYQS
jgi:hypothetical protein